MESVVSRVKESFQLNRKEGGIYKYKHKYLLKLSSPPSFMKKVVFYFQR